MKSLCYLGATALMAVCTTLMSCSDDANSVKSYPLTINLASADLVASNLSEVKVIVSGAGVSDTLHLDHTLQTQKTYTQGSYKLTVSGKVNDEATAYVQGTAVVDLFDAQSVRIKLDKYHQSPLVFKTIYGTGSVRGYVLDSYIEIANNSDEVQYLDGLILAAPLANLKAQTLWQKSYPDYYHDGGALNGIVLAFPGTGKQYPLLPGQAVVVADQAIDHTKAYGSDESKKSDYAKSPNLLIANFEKYYGNGDVDNEQVPNMVTLSLRSGSKQKQWAFGVMGRAYMLIKLPQGTTPDAFMANQANFTTMPGSTSADAYMKIPSKYVLDAVDVYASTVAPADHFPYFGAKDDANGVQAAAMYSGGCVRRKVSKVVNGRPYYQDTNNSASDFKTDTSNTPGITPQMAD